MFFGMTDSLPNIEPVARTICARELGIKNVDAEVPALVERYWRVTAALLEAGLIDHNGVQIPHSFEEGQAVWAN